MERLTDRARATILKDIITRMEAGGFEVAKENKIYVALAEYENVEELIEMTTHAPALSYQIAATKAFIENGKHKIYFDSKATKTIFDELASYAIDEDAEEDEDNA